MELLAPILIIALFIALGVSMAVYGILALALPVEGYLKDRLVPSEAAPNGPPVDRFLYHVMNTIVPKIRPISEKLYGSNTKFIQEIRENLVYCGKPAHEEAVWQVITQHLIIACGASIVGAVLGFNNGLADPDGMLTSIALYAIILALIGLLFPRILLKQKAQRRQTEIYYTLPDVLDLLIVCVESGMSIDAAMQRVGQECDQLAPEIGYDLKRTLGEINAGIPRGNALTNLGKRTTVEELRSLCTMIVQSDKLGVSIANALRTYAKELRTKRRQHAEELAQKAAVKMMFPLVLLIFPPLFIIILGPAMIQIMDTFATMM